MTTLENTECESGRASFSLIGFAGRALRIFYRAMKMRSERAALQAMPDYLLKDMGIGRSEIDHYTAIDHVPSDTCGMDIGNVR